MKTVIYPNLIKNFIATSLAIAVFITSSMVALATPGNQLMGELIVTGTSATGDIASVSVNGERATSGRSITSSTTVTTPADSSAVINLGKAGRIEIAPNSSLNLNFTENTISAALNDGQVKVSSAAGVATKLATKNGVVTNDAARTSVFAVDTNANTLNAENGVVFLNNEAGVTKVGKQDDDNDGSSADVYVPLAILAGAVGASLIYVFTRDDDNLTVVSPSR